MAKMGRPSLGKTVKVSLTLDEGTWKWIDKRSGGNLSAFLRKIILKERDKMEQITLKTIFLAMTYTARKEGLEIDQKYLDLEEEIHNYNDLDVTDMLDNMENVYKLIEREEEEEEEE